MGFHLPKFLRSTPKSDSAPASETSAPAADAITDRNASQSAWLSAAPAPAPVQEGPVIGAQRASAWTSAQPTSAPTSAVQIGAERTPAASAPTGYSDPDAEEPAAPAAAPQARAAADSPVLAPVHDFRGHEDPLKAEKQMRKRRGKLAGKIAEKVAVRNARAGSKPQGFKPDDYIHDNRVAVQLATAKVDAVIAAPISSPVQAPPEADQAGYSEVEEARGYVDTTSTSVDAASDEDSEEKPPLRPAHSYATLEAMDASFDTAYASINQDDADELGDASEDNDGVDDDIDHAANDVIASDGAFAYTLAEDGRREEIETTAPTQYSSVADEGFALDSGAMSESEDEDDDDDLLSDAEDAEDPEYAGLGDHEVATYDLEGGIKAHGLPKFYRGEEQDAMAFRSSPRSGLQQWQAGIAQENAAKGSAQPAPQLSHAKTRYMGDEEIAKQKVGVDDGKLALGGSTMNTTAQEKNFRKSDGSTEALVPSGPSGIGTQNNSGRGKMIYVMTPAGEVRAVDPWAAKSVEEKQDGTSEIGFVNHSSLVRGGKVAGAGELTVDNGQLTQISDASGHYKPDAQMTKQTLDQFQSQGVNTDTVDVKFGAKSPRREATPEAGDMQRPSIVSQQEFRSEVDRPARPDELMQGADSVEKRVRLKKKKMADDIAHKHDERQARNAGGAVREQLARDEKFAPAMSEVSPRLTADAQAIEHAPEPESLGYATDLDLDHELPKSDERKA